MEVPKSTTYGELCAKIAEHLSLPPSSLQIFKDQKFTQKMLATNATLLEKAGIADGVKLFVQNEGAKLKLAQPKPGEGTDMLVLINK